MIPAEQGGFHIDADPTWPPALTAAPGLLKAILGDRRPDSLLVTHSRKPASTARGLHPLRAERCHHCCSFSSSLCPFPTLKPSSSTGWSCLHCCWAGNPHGKTGPALCQPGQGQSHPGGCGGNRQVRARGTANNIMGNYLGGSVTGSLLR